MLEHFEIQNLIGQGATSEVYQAKHIHSGATVALKKFHSLLSNDQETMKRIQSEVTILKQLNHPNIVGMRGEHTSPSNYWLEFDFVDGYDLRSWSQHHRTPLIEPKLYVLAQIARGVAHAHAFGIIHRDLKPENILISRDGEVKVADFGLARSIHQLTVTRMGLLVGSLGYMAPEVINGARAEIKSDIFSFGVMAYEFITGENPFSGETPQAIIRSICDGRRNRTSSQSILPPRLRDLFNRCLNPDLAQRPESLWTVEAEILNVLLETGLSRHLPTLIKSEIDSHILKVALETKYRVLEATVTALESSPDSTRLIPLLSEVRRLFPESSVAEKAMALLERSRPKGHSSHRRHKLIVGFGLIALIAVGSMIWISQNNSGFVSIESPKGTLIEVDGTQISYDQQKKYQLKPGTHQLKITQDGYEPVVSQIEVKGGETSKISIGGED